ncbi:uncharacterized protein MELLADRAFT_69528 [Melampsora larici-populina 98AG31]|uniref:Uncharacterized protein n=1 Tax=Melampsora larici-populina (strain 98AG31 / pathotype 3-4-7) TaxID=747676 RepID=F4SB27_MELLP|nr:uncharacterized protein MELLADRAFT_69528 [Melampsora larici-populina 98AG31]EGF98158.1 hypothetical protein MELLADRAFT_69528 [Melampsora larici-populina 98AG31]
MSRPMQRQWSAPASQNTSKPTQLSNTDKIRLFDQAFSSQSKSPSASANASVVTEDLGNDDEETINLTTAYSAIASNVQHSKVNFFMDTGSNKDIFNDVKVFDNLHSIQPVTIKSANGGVIIATQAGDVTVIT